jgi:hypothetical protein
VKTRFQSLPFKCNLQRYTEVDKLGPFPGGGTVYDYYVIINDPVGLCTLESS